MDILKDRFEQSVFRRFNAQFWNPALSWRNKYKNFDKAQGRKYPSWASGLTDSFSDAWHIVKLISIITLIVGFCIEKDFVFYDPIIYLLIWGTVFKSVYVLLSRM